MQCEKVSMIGSCQCLYLRGGEWNIHVFSFLDRVRLPVNIKRNLFALT